MDQSAMALEWNMMIYHSSEKFLVTSFLGSQASVFILRGRSFMAYCSNTGVISIIQQPMLSARCLKELSAKRSNLKMTSISAR